MNDVVIRSRPSPPVRPRAAAQLNPSRGFAESDLSFLTSYADFTKGVIEGLTNSLKGAWGLVSHDLWQARTYVELATTVTALALIPLGLEASLAYDELRGTQIVPRQLEIIDAISQLVREMPRWTSRQWGQGVGRLVGDVILTRGAGSALKIAGQVGGSALKVAGQVGGTATQLANARIAVATWDIGTKTPWQATRTVALSLPTILTDVEGYFIMPLNIKIPFNLRVQRFGRIKIRELDCWGPRTFGTSQGAARRFNAILTEWNSLTQYTKGTILKGTNIKFGLTGSQGWKYPGGLYQVEIESKLVIDKVSTMLPKGK